MLRQTGEPCFDADGRMRRGVIVRHLVLPGHTEDSINAVRLLHRAYGDRIYISIMRQYTPCGSFPENPELSRRLTTYEYEKVLRFALVARHHKGICAARRDSQGKLYPGFRRNRRITELTFFPIGAAALRRDTEKSRARPRPAFFFSQNRMEWSSFIHFGSK